MDRCSEEEWSRQELLVSDKYPMTAAALLVRAAHLALEEISCSPEAGIQLDKSYFQSAFKFLKRYNNLGEPTIYKNGTMIKSGHLLTVYSSPCELRRKQPVSSKLPQYVKRVMQRDASLRRLIKDGNITISRVLSAGDDEIVTESSQRDFCDDSNTSTEILRQLAAAAKTKRFFSFQEGIHEKDCNPKSGSDARAADEPRSSTRPRIEQMPSTGSIWIKSLEKLQKPDVERIKAVDGLDISTFLEISLQEHGGGNDRKRKFACLKCPKRFCWSTDLKRHALTHTGERPFKCQLCRSTFTRKFLMQKHVRKYHMPNELECGLLSEYDILALEEDAEASRYPSDGTDEENSLCSRSNDKVDIPTFSKPKRAQSIVVNVYSSVDEFGSVEIDEVSQTNEYSSCSQDSYCSIRDAGGDDAVLESYKQGALAKVAVIAQS